jgi:dynein light chain 1
MPRLRVLSLARNCLKKLERLEDVAGTLEELWASYNGISSLDGLQACTKLRVLYLSNNLVRWRLPRRAGVLPPSR